MENFWTSALKCSLPDRLMLHETLRMLSDPSVNIGNCLDVGTSNPVMSMRLRKCGGTWNTLLLDGTLKTDFEKYLGSSVEIFSDPSFPYQKDSFDTVVVWSGLEKVRSDQVFIEECHRVLKPDGRLIVNVANDKPWTLLRWIERLAGMRRYYRTVERRYTESLLFELLKNGFDVYMMRSYSRFFVEVVHILSRRSQSARACLPRAGDTDTMRVLTAFRPIYWLAFQIDVLLFFTRGYRLVALAKRRAWRSRHAPVLIDGRSISEAVLARIRK